jgi:hypothetical protein
MGFVPGDDDCPVRTRLLNPVCNQAETFVSFVAPRFELLNVGSHRCPIAFALSV